MILNKCLDDEFLHQLVPGGKLEFVIPSIRQHWCPLLPRSLHFELCEGNVFRVSDDQDQLLALQYRRGRVAIFSNWLGSSTALGWISLLQDKAIARLRQEWENCLRFNDRIEKKRRARLGCEEHWVRTKSCDTSAQHFAGHIVASTSAESPISVRYLFA